ncbi:MAG: amino acid adenylation domain-containing protein [Candidatus Electrothrix sp. YB6]
MSTTTPVSNKEDPLQSVPPSAELPIPELPADFPRSAASPSVRDKISFTPEAELTRRIEKFCAQEKASLSVLLLAVFKVFLYRYTGHYDIVVNTVTTSASGRNNPDHPVLSLHTRLEDDLHVAELLERVQQAKEATEKEPDAPCRMMLVLYDAPASPDTSSENKPESYRGYQEYQEYWSKCDLAVLAEAQEDGLQITFVYNAGLFSRSTAERFLGNFRVLLSGMVENDNPQQQIARLPLLTAEEQHQVLVAWNSTEIEYPQDKCIHQLFEEQAEKTPDAVALVFQEQELTYQELNRRANQLAHYLQQLSVEPDTPVGISIERSLEMVIGILGILKAGGAYVPIDPAYPEGRIAYMLENSQVPVLLTQKHLQAALPEYQGQVLCLDTDWDSIAAESGENSSGKVQPGDLAYIMYTSGSTGRPKGVLVPHQGLCNLAQYQIRLFDVRPTSRYLQFASLSFDPSISDIITSLCAGARLCLIPPESSRLGAELKELLLQYKITHIDIVPPALATISGEVLPDLRAVIVGGDVCTQELVREWSQGRKIFNTYGPTEATVIATAIAYADTDQKPTIGRPISNTQVYILDRFLQPVPIGVAGELYIGGVGVARGYLNRPELTAESFLPDPFSTEKDAGMYKTGDLARWLPDGEIEFLGRIDHQVKIRGNRIELAEIENTLEKHPEVDHAVVLAHATPAGDKRLAAYTVSAVSGASRPDSDDLRKFLGNALPDYMVPSAFVSLDAFPLTPNGKVDRRALPVPDFSTYVRTTDFVAPRNALEQELAEIWSEVLGLSPLGIHDNFIEVGGHSLLAVRIIALLHERLQAELPLNRLLACPTIAELSGIVSETISSKGDDAGPVLQPISREQNIPLSFGQEQMWLLHQLTPEEPIYNETTSIHFNEKVNIPALEASLTEFIRRHEILRTTYEAVEGRLYQRINPPSFSLPVADLREIPAAEREAEMVRVATEHLRKPFDLEQGPVLRMLLIQFGEKKFRLYFSIHHIISDAESDLVMLREVKAIYTAFCQGRPSPLPELPVQYADFSVWQRQFLKKKNLADQLAYWKKRLENLPRLLLPVDRPRTPRTTSSGSFVRVPYAKDLLKRLTKVAQGEGVTLFTTLATAIKVLLHRYSGQEDILLGTFNSQRDRQELEGLVGYFLNTLVLRSDLDGNPRFRDLLKQVWNTCLSAYANQDVPFQKVVEALNLNFKVNQDPMIQVAFTIDPPLVTGERSDWKAFWFELDPGIAKFDLTFYVFEEQGQTVFLLEYNSELFDRTTAERIAQHFTVLLEGITADPDQKISSLPLLPEQERCQLLIDWNSTQAEYPREKCIQHLFEEQADKTPDAVAVMFEGQELTYRELNCRVNQLAHYLRKQGIQPESLVGICLERSLEMLIGLLGILKAGGAYVPLDPNYPQDRIDYILSDSGAQLLLTSARLLSALPGHADRAVCMDTDQEAISAESQENPEAGVGPDNLSYVIYTSGSTGRPKGVQISHQSLVNFIWSMKTEPGLESSDRLLAVTTICFDIHTLEIYLPLAVGAAVVLASREVAVDGFALAAAMAEYDVTAMQATPATWRMLLLTDWPGKPDLKAICGGEALQRKLADALLEKTGSLWNIYGPTETTVWSTLCEVKPDRPARHEDGPELIGRPIANTQIYIMDRQMQPVPIGVAGELFIGGDGVARGYLNRPELTAERFVDNPFAGSSGSSRLYRTGDLVRYLPDGNIEYLSRIDHQVKLRGFRIELGEIEAALSQDEAVREAAVILHEQEDNKFLAAYLVLSDGQEDTDKIISDLQDRLKLRLPEYMIPTSFTVLASLPLTPNGKIDRRALPVPDASSFVGNAEFVAPRNKLEQQLAEIWSELLGVSPIGVYDNFVELGGHSLLAVRVIMLVKDRLQVELPMRRLFESPTIDKLAGAVREYTGTETGPALQPVARDQNLPLSFGQEQLWLIHQLMPEIPSYNMECSVHIDGQLNLPALENSLTELVRRHEILRTTYPAPNGQPYQKIHPPFPVSLSVIDLQGLSGTEQEAEAQRIAAEEVRKPFDLAQGPVLRTALIRLADTDHRLCLSIHHILADAESLNDILLPELEALYTVFSQGEPSPLTELPVQYADFAAWQRERLRQDVIAEQLAYWKQTLNNAPQLQLPLDRPRTPQMTSAGSVYRIVIPEELTGILKTVSRKEGVTLFMTLVAAFKVLLYRYSTQEDIVIGTVSSQRSTSELQNVIGYFLNTLVLRSDLGGNPGFRNLLKRIQEVTTSAYANQDVPFEMVVDALRPERQLNLTPFFQVLFVFLPPLTGEQLGWSVNEIETHPGTARLDLTFTLEERSEEGIVGQLEYNTDLFDNVTIERMAEHFTVLLEGIAADPDQRITGLPLLTEQERQQVLVDWNSTQVDYPWHKPIHQQVEEQADKTPDAVAAVFEAQELTYRELNSRANQLAHYLRKQGIQPESLVGICIERSFEMIVGLLGILKAGGAYVPLDPGYPQERLEYMIENSEVSVLLTQNRLQADLPEYQGKILCLDTDWETIAAENQEKNQENPVSGITPENLIYVIYTSGSTGKPKGTMNTHKGLINRILWMQDEYRLTPEDRVLQKTPFSFDVSGWEFWWPLIIGSRLVIAKPEGHKDPAYLVELINGQQITVLHFVPSMLQIFLENPAVESCSSLKQVFCSGEALPVSLQERFFTRLQPEQAELHNLYGPTEAAIDVTYWPCQPGTASSTVPIGRPVANTQTYVLDDQMQPVPIGAAGELYLGGVQLARGYLHRPELTAGCFVENPFADDFQSPRLYKTGDLACWRHDGNLEYLGRIDHQIKLRGFRIELGEIEAVLSQHETVGEAVVVLHERGDNKFLAAYITEAGSAHAEISALRAWLGQSLPEYMIPASFTILDSIPLTPNGKADRKALPEPDQGIREVSEKNFVAPSNTLEQQLTAIWEILLQTQPISVRDNFFHLGGNSLLAARLFAEIEKTTDRQLPMSILLEAPTVEQLANVLKQEGYSAPGSTLVPIPPGGSRPPFFFVPQGGSTAVSAGPYREYIGADQPLYGIQPLGFEEGEEPYARVEDMAAYYILKIRKLQPDGPYYLGGPCFGACVSFEMARQLREQGCTVGLVALLDPPDPPVLPNCPTKVTRHKKIGYYARNFLSYSKQGQLLPALTDFLFYRRYYRVKNKFFTLYNKLFPAKINRLEYTLNAHIAAQDEYIPQFYPGKITIFRNEMKLKKLERMDSSTFRDWSAFAGDVDYRIIKGHHLEMFDYPLFPKLAEELRICLEEAQGL